MSRWSRLLLVSLPLAVALTATFRFIQHTDHEYSFWMATYGQTASLLEARCAALKAPEVCTKARERRSFAGELQTYHKAVMAWWWPALLATLLAWLAAAISVVAIAGQSRRRHRIRRDPTRGASGN